MKLTLDGVALDDEMIARLAELVAPMVEERLARSQRAAYRLFPQAIGVYVLPQSSAFLEHSNCLAEDFLHPTFSAIVGEIGLAEIYHRKLWEWVFIIHNLRKHGCIGQGRRGLVFGVGQEMLPAIFAGQGCEVVATDAPAEIGVVGWQASAEYASGLTAMPEGRLDRATFEQRVSWRECDMRAIPPDLTDFDFCWSSCCLEHLGSIEAGLQFIEHSVEKTLKPGGVAVHTTELNLSSNDETYDGEGTALYRRRDLERLIERLRVKGHTVDDLIVKPGSLVVDGFVDAPPFSGPHLKLELGGYVSTSVGIVVRKSC